MFQNRIENKRLKHTKETEETSCPLYEKYKRKYLKSNADDCEKEKLLGTDSSIKKSKVIDNPKRNTKNKYIPEKVSFVMDFYNANESKNKQKSFDESKF